MRKEAIVQAWMRKQGQSLDTSSPAAPVHNAPAPAPRPASPAPMPAPAAPQAVERFDRAINGWLVDIASATIPKILVIMLVAITEFGEFFGMKRSVHDATRVKIGRRVSHLRAQELATGAMRELDGDQFNALTGDWQDAGRDAFRPSAGWGGVSGAVGRADGDQSELDYQDRGSRPPGRGRDVNQGLSCLRGKSRGFTSRSPWARRCGHGARLLLGHTDGVRREQVR